MTPHEYLSSLLQKQTMLQSELDGLRRIRVEIESHLSQAYGSSPRFYYGGSLGKGTMIREAYDLDIVMYFPTTQQTPLRDLFWGVHTVLTRARYTVEPKTVALRLPYKGGFHVDVVPGRAQDSTFKYATLYKNAGSGSTLQTSLKVHIDAVRKTGIADIVKLMKLWRLRHGLAWPTFAIEIVVERALHGRQKSDLGNCMQEVFRFIVGSLQGIRLVDPANTNNEIEMTYGERAAVVAKATQSLNAPYWENIVW